MDSQFFQEYNHLMLQTKHYSTASDILSKIFTEMTNFPSQETVLTFPNFSTEVQSLLTTCLDRLGYNVSFLYGYDNDRHVIVNFKNSDVQP